MSIKALIIEDEPLARNLLKTYMAQVADCELVGLCENAFEAFSIVAEGKADLMFLDINMPGITGIDFLKTLKSPPLVVFTTAFSQFAAESYELNAIDYLVKPITFERFMKAIDKVRTVIGRTNAAVHPISNDGLFVRSDGKNIKISISELWLIEGVKNYVRFHSTTGAILVHNTLKNVEERLALLPQFLRVNKSYIVNVRFISEISGNTMTINGQPIIIGSTYREKVMNALQQFNFLKI